MLTFVTANAAKAAELERLLGRAVAHQPLHLDEIQAVELEPVVRHKAAQAYSALRRPVLVEDTGLAFAAWNGLPGALIAWFVRGLGNEGLCRLLDSHRAATATMEAPAKCLPAASRALLSPPRAAATALTGTRSFNPVAAPTPLPS